MSKAARRPSTSAHAHSTGSFTFKDASKYDGEYSKDSTGQIVRHGQGTFQSTVHQTVFRGTWANDKMNGVGRIEYKNGAVYEGTLKDNRYEGEGRFVWPDGAVYVGEWHDNRMHGTGKYTGKNGDVWSGSFTNGNGEGLVQELS